MTGRKFPETPLDVGEPDPKTNPALFALTLANHSGFDALAARTLTPPPQYTRHEQPRLTLLIPEEVAVDEEPTSVSSEASPQDSPDIPSTGSSPLTTTPTKQPESKLFLKVKAEVKRRGKGLRSRLRKSAGSPKSSSSSILNSPLSPLQPPDSVYSVSSEQNLANSSVQELDGRQIEAYSGSGLSNITQADNHTSTNSSPQSSPLSTQVSNFPQVFQRSTSVSSIVPTPRRGLSLALSPNCRDRSGLPPTFNSADLRGRLESINDQDSYDVNDHLVSPCSPASPTTTSILSPSLVRSNARIERIFEITEPISPTSPGAGSTPPPSSPTLEGRLNFLPRLNVSSPLATNSSSNQIQRIIPRQFAELDHGKELVAPSTVPESIGGWYSSSSSSPSSHATGISVPRIIVDQAANAPEAIPNQWHSQASHTASSPNSRVVPQHQYTGRPYQSPSPLAELTGLLCDALLSGIGKATEILRQAYGPEPSVPERHVRVRWKCVRTSSGRIKQEFS
jgi:hypothetical protein